CPDLAALRRPAASDRAGRCARPGSGHHRRRRTRRRGRPAAGRRRLRPPRPAQRAGITIIVIEHHAELVAKYAKTVVLMSEGQVSWCLPVAEALSRTADLEAADIPAPQVV